MDGRELYEMYQKAEAEVNACGTDDWGYITDATQAAWNQVAVWIEEGRRAL